MMNGSQSNHGKRLVLRKSGAAGANGGLNGSGGDHPAGKKRRRVNILKYAMVLIGLIMIARYSRMDSQLLRMIEQSAAQEDGAGGGSDNADPNEPVVGDNDDTVSTPTTEETNSKVDSAPVPRKPNQLYNSAEGGPKKLQAVKLGEEPPADVFAYPDLEAYEVDEGFMEPVFTCSNPRNNKDMLGKFKGVDKPQSAEEAPPDDKKLAKGTPNKLVFVHVFKTAGSTLRAFFDEYARVCGVGFSVTVHCSDAFVDSIGKDPDTPWKSSTLGPCPTKRFTLRSGLKGAALAGAPNKFIRERFDIVGGHLPLGAGVVFLEPPVQGNERPEHVRYVAFFRGAVDKYVSGVKFALKSEDMEEVSSNIRRRIPEERALGRYHAKYSRYLITPYQRKEYKQRGASDPPITAEELTAQIMTNLIEYRVIVGVTEHMSNSMELIEHFLDPTNQATNTFLKYGRSPKEGEVMPTRRLSDGNDEEGNDGDDDEDDDDELGDDEETSESSSTEESTGPKMKNVSKLSTSALLEELRKDTALYEQMMEYVKYEQEIFHFAEALHKKQFAAYLKKTGRTTESKDKESETVDHDDDDDKDGDTKHDDDDDDEAQDDDDDDATDDAEDDDDDDDDKAADDTDDGDDKAKDGEDQDDKAEEEEDDDDDDDKAEGEEDDDDDDDKAEDDDDDDKVEDDEEETTLSEEK